MSIPGSATPLLLATTAAAPAAALQVDRSLRFNSADSAYLNRTPSSAGNRKTWTWSGWIKKSTSVRGVLFGGGTTQSDTQFTSIEFESDDTLRVTGWNTLWAKSDALFRDYSAWAHVVISFDSTQSSASDQIKMYVNGQQLTKATENALSQNGDYGINQTVRHTIGAISEDANPKSDFYLAEINFIDGQALAPTDFGQTDSDNNWNPKAYSGTYGTNGFHLDFADSADLGDDNSGNGNDWTPNNLVGSTFSGSYLSLTSATGTGGVSGISSTYPLSDLYDGDTSTFVSTNFANISSNPAILTLTFSPGIPFSSTVRARSYKGSGETVTYNFNGEGSNSWGSTGVDWQTVKSGSGVMTSLVITRQKTNTNGGAVEVYGLEVDGVLLTGNLSLETDSFIDTPTNYDAASGNNGGNYATLNPLAKGSNITLSNGNLDVSSAGHSTVNATIPVTSGLKVYMEFTRTGGTSAGGIGFTANLAPYSSYPGQQSNLWWVYDNGANFVYSFDGSFTQYGAKIGTNDCVQLAIDYDAGKAYIGVNNTWFTTSNGTNGNPATGANPTFTFSTSLPLFPLVESAGYTFASNFGQRPFKYTPPTGFKSHCTQNLADPTIADGSTAFDAKLWTGNGSSQSISGLSFSPDLVWIKQRSTVEHHALYDVIRGATNQLYSNLSAGQVTQSTTMTAFNSDGFSVGSDDKVNENNQSHVGWVWDAGTSTGSNTDGSVTSNVRASQTNGFSIVKFTGTGSAETIGHGLNAEPYFMMVKYYGGSGFNWAVYHKSLGNTGRLLLNDTMAFETGSGVGMWNNTTPTSSVFSVGSYFANNHDFIGYCFSPVSQYSAFGSYTGNGSSDGPFVFTGFKPALILYKRSDSTGYWRLMDSTRDPDNVAHHVLFPNTSDSESATIGSNQYDVDILSNGFKIRTTLASSNASGGTFVYACFASHPFKTARAR